MKILKCILLLVILCQFPMACKQSKETKKIEISDEKTVVYPNEVDAEDFKTIIEGDSVNLYTLTNKNGIKMAITNYGQRLVSLYAPDKDGNFADVVLGFPTLDQYMGETKNYYGATIGRYGNRIANGKITIEGEEYTLATNNQLNPEWESNHLHGGDKGFESVVWNVDSVSDSEITFSRTSPDMEEGYPGSLNAKVTYVLTNDNELKINYEAVTDKTTVVNLTHHSYFHLGGEGNGSTDNHLLQLNADYYTPVDRGLIPTGKIEEVAGTPFDFTEPKAVGKDLEVDDQQLKMGQGYDHNFVLNDMPKNEDGLVYGGKLVDPESGRVMEFYTDEPGVQFYNGNFMDGSNKGKNGKPWVYRGGICLETQHFPDSPNKPDFPTTLLKPGETYRSNCVYKFGVQ